MRSYSLPYSVWTTGIFWRNDKLNIDPASMSNPYDVFWDNPPKDKTHSWPTRRTCWRCPCSATGSPT